MEKKIVNTEEVEKKNTAKTVTKQSLWDMEFLVYQWYERLNSLGIVPGDDVSRDVSFRNINMCTLFTKERLNELHGVFKIFY